MTHENNYTEQARIREQQAIDDFPHYTEIKKSSFKLFSDNTDFLYKLKVFLIASTGISALYLWVMFLMEKG